MGYSSLNCVRQLPLDFIKLDRTLVEAIDTDPRARTIAASIVTLADALSLTTIAEGVERASLVDPLAEMGCDYGRGWHYGPDSPLALAPSRRSDHRRVARRKAACAFGRTRIQ